MPAPVYPLAMPRSPGFTDSTFSHEQLTVQTRSIFDARRQVQESDFALWRATLTLPRMTRLQAGEWQSFFMQLRGRLGTFLLHDPDRLAPLGGINNNGTIRTATALGDFDVAITLPSGTTGGLLPGDYVQIGRAGASKLHKVVSASPVSGTTLTISVMPTIKAVFAVGTPVNFGAVAGNPPQGVFAMSSDTIQWQGDRLSLSRMAFACEESL